MEKHTDEIIDTTMSFLPKEEKDWTLVGFLSRDEVIYTFGNDSKILGRLFEVIVADALAKTAQKFEYTLHESEKQTVYPDFYFQKPDGKRIAVDVKTTYRECNKRGTIKKYGFTGGSYTSFMRNGKKNISGLYSDYEKHYILGVVYYRQEHPTMGRITLDELENIVPAYYGPEVFVQEKYRICGEKKGSGNTDNIGTIKANDIEVFSYGAGPFSFLGKSAFHDYWAHYPKYKDNKTKKKGLYTDIKGYIQWLRDTRGEDDLADTYQEKYNQYLSFIKENGWS